MKKFFVVLCTIVLLLSISCFIGCEEKKIYVRYMVDNRIIQSTIVKEESFAPKISEPTKQGYTFEGWFTDENYRNKYDFSKKVKSSVNLYAKFTINTYTVTFIVDNTTYKTDKNCNYGTKVQEPTKPYKVGYTFSGWYSDKYCYNKYDFSSTINSDLILYGKYTINTYTVTFNIDNVIYKTYKSCDYGTTIQVPTSPQKTGYTFVGWYLDKNYMYPCNFSSTIQNDLVLYGKFKIDSFIATFVVNNTTYSTYRCNYGTTLHEPITPSKTGYTFVGWYLDENYTKQYNFKSIVQKNVTLYARFTINTYTTTFVVDNATYKTYTNCNYGEKIQEPISPQKTGYEFKGWYSDVSHIRKYDFSSTIKNDLVLYAKFEKIKCTITFHYNNGASDTSKQVEYGDTVSTPTRPSKTNYIFLHWSYDSYYDYEYDFSSKVTYDIDLYARYVIDSAKLTNKITTDLMSANVKVIKISYNTGIFGIVTKESTGGGSGIIYQKSGTTYYLLTNNHVIKKQDEYEKVKYEIEDYKGNKYSATLIKNSADYDLAVLTFTSSTSYATVSMAKSNPKYDDDIIAVGQPDWQINAITFGNVNNYKKVTLDNTSITESNVKFNVMVHTAKTQSGSSGCAILNVNLEIVGIHYAGRRTSTGDFVCGYAIPIEKVKEFLSK